MTTEPRETSVFADPYEKEVLIDNLVTSIRSVQRSLFFVAFIFFANDLLSFYLSNSLSTELVSMALVVPALYIGLVMLARSRPLLASIIGLVLFIGIVVLTMMAAGATSVLFGWVVRAAMIVCLLLALSSARDAEKAKRRLKEIE